MPALQWTLCSPLIERMGHWHVDLLQCANTTTSSIITTTIDHREKVRDVLIQADVN